MFTSTRDGGDRDIFIADNDGSNPVNLTAGSPAEDHDPVIREDGDRIVFVSDRDGGDSDIFVMNADGSDPVNLTSNSPSEDREPVIAGKLRRWIFFSSNRDGDYDIYSMEIDGASLADQWTVESVPPSNETAPWVTPHAVAGVSLFTTTDRFGGDLDIMEQGHNLTPDSDGDDTNHGGWVPRPINERLFFLADVFQSDRDGDADVYIDDDPTIDLVGAENLTGDAPGFDGLPAGLAQRSADRLHQ